MKHQLEISKIGHFSGHIDSIYALATGENGNFYTGGADGLVVRWNLFTGPDGVLIMRCSTPVYALLVLDDDIVIAGTREGNLHIGDAKNAKELRWIACNEGPIYDIKWLNGLILLATGNGRIGMLSDKFNWLNSIQLSAKSLRNLCMLSKEIILCGSSDHGVYQVNIATHQILHRFDGHSNSVFALTSDPDSQTFYSGGRDAHLIKRNALGEILIDIPAHLYHINYLDTNFQTGLMLSCSMDKTIKIWDFKTGSLLKVIDHARYQSHTNCVNKVLWIDANHFISCSDDRTAMAFRITNQILRS